MNFFAKTQRATSVAALALALALAGCSAQPANPTAAATSSDSAAAAPNINTSGTEAELASSIADATHYDADDLLWDAAKETTITLADGASVASGTDADGVSIDGDTVKITAGGSYRISGKLTAGQLVVAAGDEVVRLILDNATIDGSTGSAVDIQSANEVLIFLADGTANTLSDASTYADPGSDAPNAAVYSKADLTIAGTGSLTVKGNYQDGIVSKDGLVLAAGNVTVEAADDGIKGKDYTVLLDGIYAVTAKGDGVKANNDSESDRGWLLMAGGTLDVAAGDDGIKAETTLTISAGNATVSKSEEGLEAAHIVISGGTINVTSNDDGINAAGGTTSADGTTSDQAPAEMPADMGGERPTGDAGAGGEPPAGGGRPDGDAAPGAGGERPAGGGMGGGMDGGGMDTVGDFSVDISGGTVTVNAEGDGLDSNGNATISGGTVVVNGPTNSGNGALDVNGELTVTGGTLAAAGSVGMVVTPGDTSSQSSVQITLDSAVQAGTALHITDASGAVVGTFVPTKQTQSLVLSTPQITDGSEYSVYTGGTADVAAGLGSGTTTGATMVGTTTAGEYTSGGAPGMR
ncbi:carbohydrate-binding domain-containing protein [Specibacter sp. NPDC057265]|uniref:carbohydrate-binding domain-containing protein n=1 Tax=Specibacter sp. NPDC057265 TaxID=3346075 RepID=UPI00363C4257